MERKFKSKLVPVKASEVRKQAIVQLKESIEHSKYRQIEPIDYDSYVEKNSSAIQKDICSKQLILLPSDDLYSEFTDDTKTTTRSESQSSLEQEPREQETCQSLVSNLFVSDCLQTYENNKYVVKYKYHEYGGTYRQLPGYTDIKLTDQLASGLCYEIDVEEGLNDRNKSFKSSVRFNKKHQSFVAPEKNGWLNYKFIANHTEKSLKKRYFHLRRLDSPISSRNHAVEVRYRKLNSEIQESNQMYVLEFFKEVPGIGKRNEMPKNHIMFDANITNIKNTHNLYGAYSFEITEIDPTCNQIIQHIFIADNQTRFEEWFNLLRDVITNQSACIVRDTLDTQELEEATTELEASLSFESYKSPQDALVNDKINSLATPSSPESSVSSRIVASADAVVSSLDTSPENGKNNHNFDLNKYLNENEEDLLGSKLVSSSQGQQQLNNVFDLFPKDCAELINEETELECDWPEADIGRSFLLEFEHFKLNLNLPLRTSSNNKTITSTSQSLFKDYRESVIVNKVDSIPTAINPELFYLVFSIFDVRNSQKISENFYCIPNYDIFSNQLKTTKYWNKLAHNKNKLMAANANGVNSLSKTVFSLDGKHIKNIQTISSTDPQLIKRAHLNNARRALFKIVDVHEDIFLVARIEKCLDGASVHSSIQPYLSQIQSENTRIKTAIKLHKKNQQTIKTKLANYRQPFAWAAKQLYRKISLKSHGQVVSSYELDNNSRFSVYEQDVQGMSDDMLFGYLNDIITSKEKNLSKLVEIPNADLKVFLNDLTLEVSETISPSNTISSSYTLQSQEAFDKQAAVIKVDHFEPVLGPFNFTNPLMCLQQHSPNKSTSTTINTSINIPNPTKSSDNSNKETTFLADNIHSQSLPLSSTASDTSRSAEKLQLCHKAQLIQVNNAYKSFMYVYPRALKYDQQKVFSKARNILVKIEFRERDILVEDPTNNLNCIFDLNKSLAQSRDNKGVLTSTYYTPITYHNKSPQFYDEIKVLLPLNLTERHHLFFKFYHVSCSSAKSANINSTPSKTTGANGTSTSSELVEKNLDIETLVGYSWVQCFKAGRLMPGEKLLPIAQSLGNNYLSSDAGDVKWIENMKPLFKVNLAFQTTVHTADPHIANFYSQCNKLMVAKPLKGSHSSKGLHSSDKRRAPTEPPNQSAPLSHPAAASNPTKQEITIILNDPNKEVLNNSIKALHAAELLSIVKYFPTLLKRILQMLVSADKNDSSIHAVRAILHFVWQMTSIGKIAYLKAFIRYIFYIDYSKLIRLNKEESEIPIAGDTTTKTTTRTTTERSQVSSTIHYDLISNLVVLLRQVIPLQDINQMNLIFKNCWFFLELTLKSICLYSIQYKHVTGSKYAQPEFEADFYACLQNFFDLIIESIVKYAPAIMTIFAKDPEFNDSFKNCNRSLAMFLKKCMNVLNKKFLFNLVNKYLDYIHPFEKQLFELKFNFIRIICNHEHYIALSLPIRKCLININEFTDLKHEFILSDQFRQTHFLIGVLFSSVLVSSLNENKEQRKLAIHMFRNLVCKHSFDDRYNMDKSKQSRIAALYLPLIDILIENINRLDVNSVTAPQLAPQLSQSGPLMSNNHSRLSHHGSESLTASLNRQSSSLTGNSISLSHTGTHNPQSFYTTAVMNNFTSASGSIFNGSSDNNNTNPNRAETCSVLGAIAGLNSNPSAHIESLIASTVSDTDSLSSVDDSQFKGSIKSKNRLSALINNASSLTVPVGCNSSTTNSDVMTLNNSNSINVSAVTGNDTSSSRTYERQIRKDKLETSEVKDLLISLVFVLRNLGQDSLLGLLVSYDTGEFVEFLSLIELCLKTFRYRGKANLKTLNAISKVSGLGVKAQLSSKVVIRRSSDVASKKYESEKLANKPVVPNEDTLKHQILIESNLCHQVSLIIMNILSLILIHQKDKLCENNGENPITKRLIDIYFYLLESNQSTEIKLKTFASLRHIINKTSSIFLVGNSSLCATLCLKLLKCFNSQFLNVRTEACIVLYLLMRKNYEFTRQKSISRVHSQTIISTSQLIGQMQLSNNPKVLECLGMLNNLAISDKTYQISCLSVEIQDLTKRIKNILQATSKMKNFQEDSEMLIDSQYSLAKSYGNSVELRRIWLDSMATIHVKEKNYSEAAHCYLHIAALVSQNLKHQGQYTLGCSVFKKITPNIEMEEELDDNLCANVTSNNDDLNQVKYTQTQLLDYLCKSADMLKLGERYDNLPSIFKLAVAIYETNRDYEHLQKMHQNIQRAYSYMAERDMQAREKPLGAYYRVCFYGQRFNDENGKVYIYKEPGNTKLFEITDRLRKIYAKQFANVDSVEILRDSRKPTELKLDTINKSYIQVIHVQPYFSKEELAMERVSFFERNNNLKKFFYETPYQISEGEVSNGRENKGQQQQQQKQQQQQQHQHGELLRLCKRKIILETSHWFPYVKKRILVMYEKTIDLNPLETAIDELEQKIEAFESILRKKDLTLLELYLQGAIIPQVHKGPLAYAEAFLELNEQNAVYSKEKKKDFKNVFKQLIDLYQKGIEMYGQLATKYNAADDKTSKSLNLNHVPSTKYVEMHCLLQEKFLEFENSFRNLLLIDGDFELYQKQLHKGTSKISIGVAGSKCSSSQA